MQWVGPRYKKKLQSVKNEKIVDKNMKSYEYNKFKTCCPHYSL